MIIDRFEGDCVVVEMEDKTMINIPRIILDGLNEGDIVDITVNKVGRLERENEIDKLMDELFD